MRGAALAARKDIHPRLRSVPSVHFRSLSGKVTKGLPGNYFKLERKEDLVKQLQSMKGEAKPSSRQSEDRKPLLGGEVRSYGSSGVARVKGKSLTRYILLGLVAVIPDDDVAVV